jgi:hypothetical protein
MKVRVEKKGAKQSQRPEQPHKVDYGTMLVNAKSGAG